jgi:hypothetical protein
LSPAAKRKSPIARGTKLGRKAKGSIKGDGKAAQKAIRSLLSNARGIKPDQAKEIERSYVNMAVSSDRLVRLVRAGTATTEDQRELRRLEDRMARVRAQLGAAPGDRQDEPTQPLDASDRVRFCEEHLTVADGSPFSLTGREWQRDQLWAPLDGYRLWLVDKERACLGCRGRSGAIVPSVYVADETRTAHAEANDGCAGLYAHVIWLVALQLKRQQGKTTGVAGFSIPSLFRYPRESIAYIAGSEDQSENLFRANFAQPIKGNPELRKRTRLLRTRLLVPETESEFAVYATSLAGTTGGSRTLVIIDEARDVPADIFGAFVPQVYARNGWRCPSGRTGHAWSSGDLAIIEDREGAAVDPEQARYGKACGVCGAKLEPWIGRVAVMSSHQVLDGSDNDWFENLCQELEANREPDTHVYRSSQVVNPKVSKQVVSRTESVLGRVPGLADVMATEAGGISKRKDEPVITKPELDRVMDKSLKNLIECPARAVGFLDASTSVDKTSLVIVAEEDVVTEPWARVFTPHVAFWEPAKMKGGVIDEAEVKKHVESVLTLYTGLSELWIDVRGQPWAMRLQKALSNKRAKAWTKNTAHESDAGWDELERRIRTQTIRLIDDPAIRKEFSGVVRKASNPNKVVDAQRHKSHKDITEALAICCYLIAQAQARGAQNRMRTRPVTQMFGNARGQVFGRIDKDSF